MTLYNSAIFHQRHFSFSHTHEFGVQSFTSLIANLPRGIKISFFIHLAGALMKYFLDGITPLRHW